MKQRVRRALHGACVPDQVSKANDKRPISHVTQLAGAGFVRNGVMGTGKDCGRVTPVLELAGGRDAQSLALAAAACANRSAYIPLYEQRYHQFNHRWATRRGRRGKPRRDEAERRDPAFEPSTRYSGGCVEVSSRRGEGWEAKLDHGVARYLTILDLRTTIFSMCLV